MGRIQGCDLEPYLALNLILLVADFGVEDRKTSSGSSTLYSQERKEMRSHSSPAS